MVRERAGKRRLAHDVAGDARARGIEALRERDRIAFGFLAHGLEVDVVGEAESGVQAVQKYRQLKPDLVTMDIVMPDMGGIEAVREICKTDPDAKILMCSAMGQQALVVEAIQAGAKDFVVKPFQPSRVLEAVQRVLG